jgi:PAS domain S-box-containing protein
MPKSVHSPGPIRKTVGYSAVAVAVLFGPFLLWPSLLGRLLESNEFMPHIFCLQQSPPLVWLHVVSDSLIGLSYVAISATLAYFVNKKRNLPFHWIFVAFGVFILACAGTHFMEIYTLWVPSYWLSGCVKAMTALASVVTALMLPRFVPKAIALPSSTDLLRSNQELAAEIADRRCAEQVLRDREERFRLVFEHVRDYAMFMLDPDGMIVSWNAGAERIKGYSADEIVGKHFSVFYTAEDVRNGKPAHELRVAAAEGRIEDEGWRVRKDGSTFMANVIITALRDEHGNLRGFSKVSRDITERKQDEKRITQLNASLEQHARHLEAANKELEAFSYSVSHDLRAPLRHIDGFADMLAEHAGDTLDEKSRHYLTTISNSARRMGELIDDLLSFSRTGRAEMHMASINLGELVEEVREGLESEANGRNIVWKIGALPEVSGDAALLRVVLTNLMSNAVKYTRGRAEALVEIGATADPDGDGGAVFFIRDNGAGFDMKYSDKLFGVFQRLHRADQFEGTGIGLATVRRIINRHGGRTWGEGAVDAGATFFLSFPVNGKGRLL